MRDKTKVFCKNAEHVQVSQRDRGEAWVDFMNKQESGKKMERVRGRHKDYYVKRQKGSFKYP